MQKAMRRTLGVGGATAVALAASLALAGVASAHTPTLTTSCLDNGKAELNVQLQYYSQPKKAGEHNTVAITYTPNGGKAQTVLATTNFDSGYPAPSGNSPTHFTVDGTIAGTFTVTITAWDDPGNAQHNGDWDGTFTRTTSVCEQPPTKPTTTTTTAPPTTTTTAPPTTTGETAPPTTTSAAVAPVADKTATPPGGLAYTGVSTELPLIIAGALIVLGAAALITMRVLKRRRVES